MFCFWVVISRLLLVFLKLELILNCSSAIHLCFFFGVYVNVLTAYKPEAC